MGSEDAIVRLKRERDAAQARCRELEDALKHARPVISNAAADPAAAPWLVEVRYIVLARVDAALNKAEGS